MTVEQLETFSNTKPELRYLTEEIIKYLGANPPSSPGGGSSYLVYTALLTQDGTNAPTAIELENTIGEIVWTRAVAGSYVGTLTGAFPAEKTYYIITPNKDFEQAQIVMEQSGQGFPNYVSISTYAGGGGAGQDGNMFQTPIEIRVYPG